MTMIDSTLDFPFVHAGRKPDVRRIEHDRLRALEKWSPEVTPAMRRGPLPPAMRAHGIVDAAVLADMIKELNEHAEHLARSMEEARIRAEHVTAKIAHSDQQQRFERTMHIYKRAQFYIVVYSTVCAIFVVMAVRLFLAGHYFYIAPVGLVVVLVSAIAIVEFGGLLNAYRAMRTNDI